MISSACANVPPYDDLELVFWNRGGEQLGRSVPGWSRRRLQNAPTILKEFVAVLAVHLNRDRVDSDKSSIYIYSVANTSRAAVRLALTAEGLQIVRTWLVTPRSSTWRGRRRVLQIGVDSDASRLCALETDDQRVTGLQILDIAVTAPANKALQPTSRATVKPKSKRPSRAARR
jgi:hypothetical protein